MAVCTIIQLNGTFHRLVSHLKQRKPEGLVDLEHSCEWWPWRHFARFWQWPCSSFPLSILGGGRVNHCVPDSTSVRPVATDIHGPFNCFNTAPNVGHIIVRAIQNWMGSQHENAKHLKHGLAAQQPRCVDTSATFIADLSRWFGMLRHVYTVSWLHHVHTTRLVATQAEPHRFVYSTQTSTQC